MLILGITGSMYKKPYIDVVNEDSPIGFWMFDETSGTTADDRSANSNDMTIRNGVVLNDPTGLAGIPKAFDFDGTNDVCDTALAATFNIAPNSNWSYEMWVRTTSTTSFASPGVWKGLSDQETAAFYCNVAASGRVGVRFMNSTNTGLVLLETASGSFNDGNWHHLVATGASAGNVLLYVDAVQVASSSAGRSSQSTNRQITAGANATADTSFADYIDADIAAVAVYNTALNSTRITAHYNAGI